MERADGLPRGHSGGLRHQHVEELVIHWMTTGSLDYPFARTAWEREAGDGLRARLPG